MFNFSRLHIPETEVETDNGMKTQLKVKSNCRPRYDTIYDYSYWAY